ncbi:MAG TPA: amidohydrolase family protein, partial [Actinomycetota bacterium]|jgi:imidazolonepropionase-like amidohydrolase|nr:amidohydrolase family protein [Gemmatimonadales bacterium]HQR81206.1 amidohydrolase family protein [Actinomycetota bacterium]
MRRRVVVLLLFMLVVQAVAASAQVTAIRAGRVVDPDAGTAAENQVILIEQGKITAIGGNVAIPAGAEVIDLSTSTISPGLVDAHTHLCMAVVPGRDAGNYYYTTLRDPDAFRSIEGVVNARTMLQAGFTSVRDIGNEGRYACVQVRRAIQLGLIVGPTMITAGRIIAPYGGQFHLQPDKPDLAEPEYYFADTRDEMVKAVRENAHYGATVIKIVVDDQRYIYSVEDIEFIKAQAAGAGMKLAAHAWTEPGAHNAAAAGVASIEHGFDMTDADLLLAKKNGVVLVGTEFLANGDTTAYHRQWVDRLRRAYKIGVTLVYGTDAIDFKPGITRGQDAITGIDPWVEAGVPAPAILRAMTTNGTRLLGVDDERGTLKVGQYADLIATPDNPLTNIQTLKQVSFVMKNGKVVER